MEKHPQLFRNWYDTLLTIKTFILKWDVNHLKNYIWSCLFKIRDTVIIRIFNTSFGFHHFCPDSYNIGHMVQQQQSPGDQYQQNQRAGCCMDIAAEKL